MATKSNKAAWVSSKGSPPVVGQAEIPSPGAGEIVIENKAVPLHPGDWKVLKGIIPIELKYPTVIGNYAAGIIHSVGPEVTRFKPGDRVLSVTCFSLMNDHRYGAYQRFVLSNEGMTSHIPETLPFPGATSASQIYASMSAMVLHVGLDRPAKTPSPANKNQKVLIWGGGSSFGFFAVQIAVQAGYTVHTTASATSKPTLLSLGASTVHAYNSLTIFQDLLALGPYKAIFSAQDTAADQVIIAKLLAAQGGGSFISTMGPRPTSIPLPDNVRVEFVQYMDDYFKEENEEFKRWVFGDYIERGLENQTLKLGEVQDIGGLGSVGEGLDMLERGVVRGKKLVFRPHLE
ncbi:chaperonin 10-like protein [Rhexocercosporidium sp. MPI-PUGE-AT-0058]|nr:chaperonin 10-like protein [Rhexocercosporidium sp. MPI-PUGE-AT-0058]